MGICLRRAGLVLAGIVLSTGLLAGCSDEPPEPSTIKRDHTASNTPTATPTPTSTLSTEEQQAVEAAEAVYHRFYEVVARLYKAPEDYTGSQIQTELRRFSGGDAVESKLTFLETAQKRGWMQVGERKVERVSAEAVNIQPNEQEGYPEAVLRVCLDTANIDVVETSTGESVSEPSNQTKWVSHVTFWYYEDAWHVVEEETRSEEEKCRGFGRRHPPGEFRRRAGA